VVYGASNDAFDQLVGENADNLTMSLTCWDIFKDDKKDVQVIGPIDLVSEDVNQVESTILEFSRERMVIELMFDCDPLVFGFYQPPESVETVQ